MLKKVETLEENLPPIEVSLNLVRDIIDKTLSISRDFCNKTS